MSESILQKKQIVEKLRKSGCRITRQRLLILEILLSQECTCCKEIHCRASRVDPGIGVATVYRMINKLEEIGTIHPSNLYKLESQEDRI